MLPIESITQPGITVSFGHILTDVSEVGAMHTEEFQPTQKIGLFKKSFLQDGIFILSMLAIAAVAFNTARGSGDYHYFGSYEWIVLVIDVLFASSINLFVFGVGPAMFRRSRTRKSVGSSRVETLPISKYLAFALAVVFVATTVGILGPTDKFSGVPDGAAQEECRPKGVDEMCVEVTYEGNKKLTIFTTWKYSTEKMILGQSVTKITWETKIDCNDKSGMVVDLNAFNSSDQNVEIGEARQKMIDGVNESQVQPLISSSCK